MSWAEIEIDESGKITVRRGGTLTGKPVAEPQPEPESEPKLVYSWQECVRNHPWKIDDKPKHRYPIETEPEPEPMVEPEPEPEPMVEPEPEPEPMVEPGPEPEPKPKLVVWRLCVRIQPWEVDEGTLYVKWYRSGYIPEDWYPIESYEQPIKTVQQLPEGQEP